MNTDFYYYVCDLINGYRVFKLGIDRQDIRLQQIYSLGVMSVQISSVNTGLKRMFSETDWWRFSGKVDEDIMGFLEEVRRQTIIQKLAGLDAQ